MVEYYVDSDEDGFGDVFNDTLTCGQPWGYVTNHLDCDDTDPNIHPASTEVCNLIDDDCDGLIDDSLIMYQFFQDADNDGYGNELISITTCDSIVPTGYVTGYGDGPFGGSGGEGGGGESEGNYFDSDDSDPSTNPGMPEEPLSISNAELQHALINPSIERDGTLEVFPNPAHDQITIHLHDIEGKVELTLLDHVGHSLFQKSQRSEGLEIDIDLKAGKFASGLYIVQVRHAGGLISKPFMVIR